MTERYTVITFVGPGSILCTDRFDTEPEFGDKRSAWEEATARVAHHPDEVTVIYLADGHGRSAVWSNRPDIVFRAAA